MPSFPLLLALSGCLLCPGTCQLSPYDSLYADGARAYFAQDWPRAAVLLQRSLHSYSQLREARRQCQGRCQGEAGFAGQLQPPSVQAWETSFFDRVLQRADCLEECLGSRLGGQPSLHRASSLIQQEFEKREPYNYLQVAFFKVSCCREGAADVAASLTPPSLPA